MRAGAVVTARTPIARQLRRLAHESPFYAKKWTGGLLDAAASASPEVAEAVLASLPFTTKDDLRAAQERAVPFGDYLACDPSRVVRLHRTSGTTGRPLIIGLSARDVGETARIGGQAFRCAGLRASDIVVHCLNYQMWAGGLTDHLALEATGAAVIPFGVGGTDLLRTLPRWVPFTVVSCTPSYVSLLLEVLTDEEREVWARRVRLFLVGGEPGASSPGLRAAVRDHLGADLRNANYGLAEVLSIVASQCPLSSALHFHASDALWVELVDPATDEMIAIRPGVVGEFVATHLTREAQPLVRYRTNDLLEIVSLESCECGHGGFRFVIRGRADDMFVVRGINVFPSAIADVLAQIHPSLRDFLIRLPDRPTFDSVPLEVEIPPELVHHESELPGLIVERVKSHIGCAADVLLVPSGTLRRSEGKTQRLVRDSQGVRGGV